MNVNVKKIKSTLESFFDYAVRSAEECRKIHEQYREEVALALEETCKESLYAIYLDDKKKIEDAVRSAVQSIHESDVLKGEDITRDAELLNNDRFIIGTRQFEFLVNRYAYKNNTMCALLRKFSDERPECYLDLKPEIRAALATAEERIKAWRKVESGALSLLEAIYTEHSTTYGKVHSQQKRYTAPVTHDQVEGFMVGQLSEELTALIGE